MPLDCFVKVAVLGVGCGERGQPLHRLPLGELQRAEGVCHRLEAVTKLGVRASGLDPGEMLVGIGEIGFQAHGLSQVGDGRGIFALLQKCRAPVVQGQCVIWIESECLVQVGNGPVELAVRVTSQAAANERLAAFRNQPQRSIVVGQGPVVIATTGVNRRPDAQQAGDVGNQADGRVQIGQRPVEPAGLHERRPTPDVRGHLFAVGAQGFVISGYRRIEVALVLQGLAALTALGGPRCLDAAQYWKQRHPHNDGCRA